MLNNIIYALMCVLALPFSAMGFAFEFIVSSFEDGRKIHEILYQYVTKEDENEEKIQR